MPVQHWNVRQIKHLPTNSQQSNSLQKVYVNQQHFLPSGPTLFLRQEIVDHPTHLVRVKSAIVEFTVRNFVNVSFQNKATVDEVPLFYKSRLHASPCLEFDLLGPCNSNLDFHVLAF